MHTHGHALAHTEHSSKEIKRTKTRLPLDLCVCWLAISVFFFSFAFFYKKVCIEKKQTKKNMLVSSY